MSNSNTAIKAVGLIDTSGFKKVDKSKAWELTTKHFPVPFWVESVVAASLPYDSRKGTKEVPSQLDVYTSLIKMGYNYHHEKFLTDGAYQIPEQDFHLHDHTHDVVWIQSDLNEDIKAMKGIVNAARKSAGLKHHRSVEPLFCALILAGVRVAQQTPPAVCLPSK